MNGTSPTKPGASRPVRDGRIQGTASIGLTRLQHEFVQAALEELRAAGNAPDGCELSITSLRCISPADAALLLVYIQNRHETWLGEAVSSNSRSGARQSVSGLVAKLLPIARPQVLILHRENEQRTYRGDDAAVILRLTPALLQSVAQLAELVRLHGLAYAVRPLETSDVTYRVRYVLPPEEPDDGFRSDLCVSTSTLWVRSRMPGPWSWLPPDTVRIPLAEVLPVMNLPREVEISPLVPEPLFEHYGERLRALEEEERTLEKLQQSLIDLEQAVPAEVTAMAEHLWFEDGEAPFTDAREAARKLASKLELWERSLEAERQALCRDVLGVGLEDNVLVDIHGKQVRLRVDHLDVHGSDTGIYFTIHGRRFRKDGVLGKRRDMALLHVDDPTPGRSKPVA